MRLLYYLFLQKCNNCKQTYRTTPVNICYAFKTTLLFTKNKILKLNFYPTYLVIKSDCILLTVIFAFCTY